MAKITWLGEDGPEVPGPSFTIAFDKKFHKGIAVDVDDLSTVNRAKRNRFFAIEDDMVEVDPDDYTPEPKRPGRPPKDNPDV